MVILNKKLLRDLKQNWPLLFAVSAIIAVGTGCFIGMMSAAQNLEYAKSSYYSMCRLADFWIDLKKASTSEIKRLAMISGVSEIRDRIQFQVLLDLPDSTKPIGAMVISLPDEQAPVINNIILRRGTYFTDDRANEVIISAKFADAREIRPGDTITALLNNQKKELIVVGTAISAEFVYMASPGSMVNEPGSYGLIYIKRSFAEDTFGFNSSCNSLVGLLAPEARQDSRQIVDELADRLDSYGVFTGLTRSQQFSPMVLDGEMKQLKTMAFIFPMFFLVVAALVLNVLMIRLSEQQRTIIGTLKALGYDNRALIFHFVKFATSTGLAGGLMGSLLGYWIGSAMTRMYVVYFSFPQLQNRFYPMLLLAGLGVSVLFSVFGTFKGVSKIMQLQPAEAMRQASPRVGGAVLLERVHLLWKNLDAQWQMIIRGLSRNKGRTLVAVFSACMGSSIVILAFGFVDSLDLMVRMQFEKVLQSDYHLTFSRELSSSGYDEIKRLPGVIHAEPVLTVPCTFETQNHMKRGAIIGIIGNSTLTVPMTEDNVPAQVPANGLLMTNRLMDTLYVRPGDYIDVVPVKGDRTARKVPVIAGIESMLGLVVYADYSWLSQKFSGQDSVNEVRIVTSHTDAEKKRFMKRVRAMPGLESITDLGEQKQALKKQLNGAMRVMAVVMIFFAAIIFFGTILNGTLIALSERQREMATFRTMGYYNREVSRIFLRENLFNNILGTLIGLPLGYWLLAASMKGFVTDAYSFPATLSPESYLYTILLAILFVLLSQLVVKRNLRKMNWVEALSLKE